MKRKILSLIKKAKFELVSYTCARSDMGTIHLEVKLSERHEVFTFCYGYYYGGGENNVINEFQSFLDEMICYYQNNPVLAAYNDSYYASDIL